VKIFDALSNYLENLDQKNFNKYLLIYLGVLLTLSLASVYYYYNTIKYWKKQTNEINATRDEIKVIVDRDELVQKQREEVNALLSEMPDFKIGEYFNDLISKLGLTQNVVTNPSITYADRGDKEYREVLLTTQFDMMNMKQLTELLNEIEQNKRIYTKELEIIKSKKTPNTIEVNLTIATLQRKPETTGLVE
jgi:septal ring factor EnvC (AmiA/AmiB activator)